MQHTKWRNLADLPRRNQVCAFSVRRKNSGLSLSKISRDSKYKAYFLSPRPKLKNKNITEHASYYMFLDCKSVPDKRHAKISLYNTERSPNRRTFLPRQVKREHANIRFANKNNSNQRTGTTRKRNEPFRTLVGREPGVRKSWLRGGHEVPP